MDLYSLEFIFDKVDLPSDSLKRPDVNIQATCGNLFDVTTKYFFKHNAYDVHNSHGCGKAILFMSDINNLISSFSKDFRVTVLGIDVSDVIATAKIKWGDDFETNVRNFEKTAKFLQQASTYDLNDNDGKPIGSIQVTMCLSYHGENIELPINYLGSQLNIPLTFRRKTYKAVTGEPSEAWKPLFYAPKKAARSQMDSGMEMYAQFAGLAVAPPMSSLLTPEYINKKLCGHKTCPGAKKFKEYGLGPLSRDGSGLGTVASFQNAKAYGLYGMSQAYGTMENYGAYGLFVKKPNKPKTCCGSPDCPYTIYYGKPEPSPIIEEVEDAPKKCQCKHCRKNNGSINSNSKQSSKGSSTCGNPNCPKNIPKNDFTCPYINNTPRSSIQDYASYSKSSKPKKVTCPYASKQFRQSAGADRYNSECLNSSCPYSTAKQRRQSTNGGACGGRVCPLENGGRQPSTLGDTTSPLISPRSSLEKKNCDDVDCPFYKGFKNCDDRDCHIYREFKNCTDKDCPFYQEPEEEYGPCGAKVCPIFKDYTESQEETKQKRLSLLVNDDGRKLLMSGDTKGLDLKNMSTKSKELLGTLSAADNSDMCYLISRLCADRQHSHSLNNYYSDGVTLKNINTDDNFDRKRKRKGPCSKDSCRALKYKTCSECGGVSKSGATCDNTDVSFSTISYDSFPTTEGQNTMTPKTDESCNKNDDDVNDIDKPPDKQPSSMKKKEGPTPAKDKQLVVKIPHQRKMRTRFVYHEGEAYPGIRLGHKKCTTATKNVPANMGWLWNIKGDWERKKRKGYKPGKVSKTVEERIIFNRRSKGIPDPPELTIMVKKKKNKSYNQEESESEDEEVVPKPTLLIEKKDGNYLITMNPLKDPKTLAENENPYMRCKPMQFLILKPKKDPPPPIIANYGEYDGEGGEDDYEHFYDTCMCDDDKMLDSSSSSESELNIEFTTPAGLITPERMKKMINVCNVDTQFKEADFHCSDCPVIVPKQFKKDKKKGKKK